MLLFLQEVSPTQTVPLSAQWWVQLGFIGAFIVMATITVWLLRYMKSSWEHWNKTREGDWEKWSEILLKVNAETNEALKNNTTAFVGVNKTLATLCDKLSREDAISHRMYELLIGRPCLMMALNKEDRKELMDKMKEQGVIPCGTES
jgi:hypothetical protein